MVFISNFFFDSNREAPAGGKKNENKKQMWVRKYLELQMLIKGLGLFDSKYFFKNFRMCPEKRET